MTESSPSLPQAFVLGAGLGTRLKRLTEQRPKPLVPVLGKPLIAHAFDHLLTVGVGQFIVNTHHCAAAYDSAFPNGGYRGAPIVTVHEEVLLETGGGLQNIGHLLGNAPLPVYNGDIYSTLPLAPAVEHHVASGHDVTMILRSTGGVRNVGFRANGSLAGHAVGEVTDLRHALGRDSGTHLFTGIYLVTPSWVRRLPTGKYSVVEQLLETISLRGTVGAIVIDEGEWWDLGTREQLLELHSHLRRKEPEAFWIGAGAFVAKDAAILGCSFVGAGAVVEAGAQLTDTLVWPGARVRAGAKLRRCIVTHDGYGEAADFDF